MLGAATTRRDEKILFNAASQQINRLKKGCNVFILRLLDNKSHEFH